MRLGSSELCAAAAAEEAVSCVLVCCVCPCLNLSVLFVFRLKDKLLITLPANVFDTNLVGRKVPNYILQEDTSLTLVVRSEFKGDMCFSDLFLECRNTRSSKYAHDPLFVVHWLAILYQIPGIRMNTFYEVHPYLAYSRVISPMLYTRILTTIPGTRR